MFSLPAYPSVVLPVSLAMCLPVGRTCVLVWRSVANAVAAAAEASATAAE